MDGSRGKCGQKGTIGLYMRLFGFEIKRAERLQPEHNKECQHENVDVGSLDEGIYHCQDCNLACIYINQKLTVLTPDNAHLNDKGKTINGIYQF